MEWSVLFFFNSILLGVGLAIDAFSVSLANGLSEPAMRRNKMCTIAGVFAFFQAFMPLLGWLCVHAVVCYFRAFEKWIPWIALGLLLFLGGKMFLDGLKKEDEGIQQNKLGVIGLLLQGVATSIDALSVGFTIAEYDVFMAILCALIIAAVTFIISMSGLVLGKRFGTKMSKKASMLGGVILIVIGLEIFLMGL